MFYVLCGDMTDEKTSMQRDKTGKYLSREANKINVKPVLLIYGT